MAEPSGRYIHSWHWLNKHVLARCHAAESTQSQIKGCLAPFMAMTNREQAELYVRASLPPPLPLPLSRPLPFPFSLSSATYFARERTQVDKVGKNLNPSDDPESGLHSFDNPAAGLPPGY